MDHISVNAHPREMDKEEQGRLLKAWREHIGAERKRKLTQTELAAQVALLAEGEGIPSGGRKVPGTWASMSRWENGVNDQSLVGLRLIAKFYDIDVQDLMRPPPTAAPRPKPAKVDEDEALVDAIRSLIKTGRK